MNVRELGEFGVIKLLTQMVANEMKGPDNATPNDFRLLVDAGDDTAAWRCGRGTELCTTDTAVEGVHFTRITTPWHDLGWKIMAANISDIAAMGGLPLYALITLGLPPDTEMEDLNSLYRSMIELGNRYGVAIVGGDMVRSPVVFVTMGLTGVCENEPMLRSTAQRGDLVAVTGYLGSSAGGLEIMLKGLPIHGESAEYLKSAHRRPEPCVSQGQVLSQHDVRTAMDISDGVVDDLSKLCQASGIAARLDVQKIPVHASLREVFPQEYLNLALIGGEDYQLLFTASRELMERVLSVLPPPATVIGEIGEGEPGQVTVFDSKTGKDLSTPRGGWDHFEPAASTHSGQAPSEAEA